MAVTRQQTTGPHLVRLHARRMHIGAVLEVNARLRRDHMAPAHAARPAHLPRMCRQVAMHVYRKRPLRENVERKRNGTSGDKWAYDLCKQKDKRAYIIKLANWH